MAIIGNLSVLIGNTRNTSTQMVGFPLLCWFSAVYYLLEGGVMIRWSGDVFLVGSFLVGKKSNSGPLLSVSLEDGTPVVG